MARKILIVDDEEDIREVARLSLETVGRWSVITAGSAHEGLATASAEQPDAILLDVMMPDLDGAAAFREFQAQPATCSIPVILLTAKVQAGERRRFAELGVKGVIAKPFDPMKLAQQIAGLLGWSSPIGGRP
jgi:CheY-like chemotaxis protein